MATKRMLIDAAHPEETRVAVLDGNRLEELDVESAARKQLKGNIYLAKVTRVEPSLQAAFVDYGGNRHGFLAFSEIHPDYYQIPIADREELIAEEHQADSEDADETDDADDASESEDSADNSSGGKAVETIGGDDMDEAEEHRASRPIRRYKIQEVIKRRQILLIQVVKEERGNKGAALTTYLSLAGRYCVLMPNSGRGGGISRKINSGKDRKRLKTIVSSFDLPEGVALIVRTAGADRGKPELKRDYEYLIKLWDDVRELTLKSTAPALIHEEASVINRAIRDLYSRDIEEILIEGDEGYRMAKDLMKLLIPSHAKKVQPYKDPLVPLFQRHQVENQMIAMNSTDVQLRSGGYIVINPTEALVAIDVNSGRATRGRNVEETALRTNLEAAEEISRQLRLRDLAGLIVIDFIDMEYHRNQSSVERKLKEAMRNDRARIQIGRISPFGLLELSRQRLRPSLTETVTDPCPHCGGTGIRRSTESSALHVLRGIEEEAAKNSGRDMEIHLPGEVALYILNHKRQTLTDIEAKYELRVVLVEDISLIPPDFKFGRSGGDGGKAEQRDAKPQREPSEKRGQDNDDQSAEANGEDGKRKRRRRPRRKNRGDESETNRAEEATSQTSTDEALPDEQSDGASADTAVSATSDEDGTEKKPSRRRGRRGGRRRSRKPEDAVAADTNTDNAAGEASSEAAVQPSEEASQDIAAEVKSDAEAVGEAAGTADTEEKPKRPRRRRSTRNKSENSGDADAGESTETAKTIPTNGGTTKEAAPTESAPPEAIKPEAVAVESKPEAEPQAKHQADTEPAVAEGVTVSGTTPPPTAEEEAPRRGWWRRS